MLVWKQMEGCSHEVEGAAQYLLYEWSTLTQPAVIVSLQERNVWPGTDIETRRAI